VVVGEVVEAVWLGTRCGMLMSSRMYLKYDRFLSLSLCRLSLLNSTWAMRGKPVEEADFIENDRVTDSTPQLSTSEPRAQGERSEVSVSESAWLFTKKRAR